MNPRAPSPRAQTYAIALLIGLAAVLIYIPLPTLAGAGPGWAIPIPDQAQSLAGHLAFQADPWRWPPLATERLFWPRGLSILLTDSNPLVSLLAKLWARTAGATPANWLGAFVGLCWLLQPVAAAYAARGLGASILAATAAAILACAWPALVHRSEHINLCAHALILFALGLAFRRIQRPGSWLPPAILLLAAILTQPYLFQLCAAVLAIIPLHATLRRRPGWQRDLALYAASGVFAVAVLRVLAGPLSGGDKGFVFFSMNLLSPVWPQRSGVFGAALPILDATGGQYEGLNWLGAGTLLLLAASIGLLARQRRWPRIPLAVLLILAGLALLSLSSRIYAGPYLLLDLGAKPWEDLFGTFRAPGRAFWPVGYALMLGAVVTVDRMRRSIAIPLLVGAVALQLVDITPLQNESRGWWANGYGATVPSVPPGTTLFGLAPYPGCAPQLDMKMGGPLMNLDAVRQGARLRSIGMGRSPDWFSCETMVADAMELPLLPHETRVFFQPGLPSPLEPGLLGADTVCRRNLGFVMCARDAPPLLGEAIPPAPAPHVLGLGWKPGENGETWSEGPHSSILLPQGVRRLRLRLAGVAAGPGQTRMVEITIGRNAPRQVDLPDGQSIEVVVDLPDDTPNRIALNTRRPIDPLRRGLTAPVRRAAIRLLALSAENGNGQPVALPALFASAPITRP